MVSEPSGALFRNLPPGPYRITVDSFRADVNQFADLALAAGQTIFVKIESAKLWESDLNYAGDARFYTRLIPANTAAGEVRRSRLLGD